MSAIYLGYRTATTGYHSASFNLIQYTITWIDANTACTIKLLHIYVYKNN